MVFTAVLGCNPHVGTALSLCRVAQTLKRPQQLGATNVARLLHAAMISSRTKCNLMMFGRSIVSSK